MLVKIGPLVSKLVRPIAQVYRMEAKEINNVLVEQACLYLSNGDYPSGASSDQKRSIRRKAKKLRVRNGDIFFLHRNGSEVFLY